jgi:hypothetical protein
MEFTEEFLQRELEKILATAGIDKDAWKTKIMAGLKTLLKQYPARYRGFGPYWWGLKKCFLDAGDDALGDSIDAEGIEAFDFEDEAHAILAAVMFEDNESAYGRVGKGGENTHILDIPGTIDGGTFEYTVIDEDMERMAAIIAG